MKLIKEEKMVNDLRNLLKEMSIGMDKTEATNAVITLAKSFWKDEAFPDMLFYSFLDPRTVPSDVRVLYVYTPTYLACSIMMRAALDNEELLDNDFIRETLRCGLNACTGRNFFGHGYDGITGFFEAMEIFAQADTRTFIKKYPDISEKFTITFNEAMKYLRESLCTGDVKDPWSGEGYEDRAKKTLELLMKKKVETVNIFVYGTLMKGQKAISLLGESVYRGRYALKDYAMYNLGNFPGLIQKKGEIVVGEVYAVDEDILPDLDGYEGEGSLYLRKTVTVFNEKKKISACAYIYNHSTEGSDPFRTIWGMKGEDEVWYACYGSSMSKKRFNCYIKGGKCRENGKSYPGCTDKTRWSDEAVMSFPGELYFGNESLSWGKSGVAFYDPEPEKTVYMRLYKIKLSQLLEVQKMEGGSPDWYGRIVCLGVKDNVPVYTLTSETRRSTNAPSRRYMRLVAEAMRDEMKLSDRIVLETLLNAFQNP